MNFKLAIQLVKNMGLRYVGYRLFHEFEKRTGFLKIKHPTNPKHKEIISLEAWKEQGNGFLISSRETLTIPKKISGQLKEKATRVLNGEICFFSFDWKNLGKEYDWVTNPDSGYRYDSSKHWSEIEDFNTTIGDIKYVWEKSRFSYLLIVMRYDYHFEEDHSEWVFQEVESWIDSNSINQGPNWKCSQEISLRILNWCYVLNFYKNSEALTEERFSKIMHVIYWSLQHVYTNINFSRIAVRNNHAITETLMLTISELVFPFITETKIWAKTGRKYLEQEIDYQIYEDGTFLQFSLNYHRVLIQLLSFAIAITEKNEQPLSDKAYTKAYKSLNFLYQCLQEENGYLPNYGANDGAWFFPLSDTNFRDYRPQLNTLHKILTKKELYEDVQLREDSFWVVMESENISKKMKKPIVKKMGLLSFKIGGYYLLRMLNSFSFIRCGNHKDRPSHADNLHLDVWIKGENVLRDSGTYKYNTEKKFQDYFRGSEGHNTVLVDGKSQMIKGNRFIWYFWTQALRANWRETGNAYIFKGKISAFRFINPKCTHTRTVSISKNKHEWTVTDVVEYADGFMKSQIWHYDDAYWKLKAITAANEVLKEERVTSYNSIGYGQKESGKATAFLFKETIKTTLLYKEED